MTIPLDSDTYTYTYAVIRRRCGVEAAAEECVEAHDGDNKIRLCSCDSGDLCNGAATFSSAAIYTAGKEAVQHNRYA